MKNVLYEYLIRLPMFDKHFYANEGTKFSWELLEEIGFLIPTTPLKYTHCDDGHHATIDWRTDNEGHKKPHLCCPACGMERLLDPLCTRRWLPNLKPLLTQLATKLQLWGTIVPIYDNVFWLIGQSKEAERCYFLSDFCGSARRIVCNELRNYSQPIVFTSLERTAESVHNILLTPCVPLTVIAILDKKGTLQINTDALESYLPKFEIHPPTPGRHSAKPTSRKAKIEIILQALSEHIKVARNYAKITKENGNMEILPRPTQAELAVKTNLSKSDVCRCLKDPKAKVLRQLWEIAGDIIKHLE